MTPLTETELALVGEISATRFVVEIILANWLADQPQWNADRLCRDMLSRDVRIGRGPVDADELQAMARHTKESLSRLVENAGRRAADIRNLRDQLRSKEPG